LSKPVILSSMLLDFVATFFASVNTLLPIIATKTCGCCGIWVLSAAQAVGAVLAALVISQIKELRKQGLLFLPVILSELQQLSLFQIAFDAWLALATTGAQTGQHDRPQYHRQLQTRGIRGRMIA
jgi:hypothetical protein